MSSTSVPPTVAGPPRQLLRSTTFLLKRLGGAVKERSLANFERMGVTAQQYAVLLVLEEGARETQATIADALGYDRSLLVGILDQLEQRGFVERRRDPGDRRRHLVSLTSAGTEALGQLREAAKAVEDEFLSSLDAEQRRQLHELLLVLMSHHDIRCAAAIGQP